MIIENIYGLVLAIIILFLIAPDSKIKSVSGFIQSTGFTNLFGLFGGKMKDDDKKDD